MPMRIANPRPKTQLRAIPKLTSKPIDIGRLRVYSVLEISKEGHVPETTAESHLIDVLRQRQGSMSDAKFAPTIGCTQTHWGRVKRGERRIGRRLGAGILARYGELWREVMDAVLPRERPG